ncbi:DUF6681 family protein [Candidatus Enterococcus ferrettii]|uniref:Uncharacterized protein n=1 Tax=Candidatus Enterococcus ferrettii TaxID=2815324 RepID=A0ABV0EW03_9ENTE|nr:DUF6681 family protein [Enterococcus sp. 665A]MBO1339935.1 hypothetical protein [Enterococcus sp. 665A]
MTFLLDIINGLNKFLGYLDISPKYLNRGYTILSIFPTVYILRIVYGLWLNQNYIQFFLYSVVFIVLVYFLILNIFYYFLDKNIKLDVTQLFVKYLPDDAFNIQAERKQGKTISTEDTKEIQVDFLEDYQLKLARNIQTLIDAKELAVRDIEKEGGFLISENTLYPYYYLKQENETTYSLQIGTSYHDLEKVGEIYQATELHPLGVFIAGGDFFKDGIRYHETYHLKLLARKELPMNNGVRSRRHQK